MYKSGCEHALTPSAFSKQYFFLTFVIGMLSKIFKRPLWKLNTPGMNYNFIVLFCSILFLNLFTSAKEPGSLERQIKWLPATDISINDYEKIKTLNFEGAAIKEDHLPYYHETILLKGNVNSAVVEIENAQFAPLKEQGLVPAKAIIPAEISITSEMALHKKQPYVSVSFLPFRKNSSTGTIEQLVSFNFKITSSNISSLQRTNAPTFAATSVLATGDFYKIAVTQDGVYKLTYQFLKNLGLDVDNIDPAKLRLYGNGGGMLPFANSAPRYDDLQQNAIYVAGENDGRFNQNDYVLFYGQGPTKWTYNAGDKKFHHQVNLYSDSTFYFITADPGDPAKRIQLQNSSSATATHVVTGFDDFSYHEADLSNFLHSGREWYGEQFDVVSNTKNFTFSFPNLITSEKVKTKVDAIGRSMLPNTSTFKILVDGQNISSFSMGGTGTDVTAIFANANARNDSALVSSSTVNVTLQFLSNDNSATGWLNYIEVNARRDLNFSGAGGQLQFRDTRSVGTGNVAEYTMSNVNSAVQIWDVTDPLNVFNEQILLNGTSLSFRLPSATLHQFIGFNDNSFLSARACGRIANQNLHALQQTEMIILTNSNFLSSSNKLAEFHRTHDNYSVAVVTNEQVYNEFSSGAPDVSAIRDFMKMFYDRSTSAADLPRFLLLMGDASYDNKSRVPSNTNFVLSYQSQNSLSPGSSYISDDFFGMLDDNEGDWDNVSGIMDIGVGRLPVKTSAEAETMVKKTISYASPDPAATSATCVDQSGSAFGDWRNMVSFVGDDGNGNIHANNQGCDGLAAIVKTNYPVYNIDKIYLDAYKEESTPGGQRFPDARQAIINRVQRGTLLMTYVGHGGEVGWAHERVLEVDDINSWTNSKSLAAFLTATCEFTRVDDPARTSAGELVLLNPNGGGIGLFTTTRLAYSTPNQQLCVSFFHHFFEPINGKMPTMGDIFELTKVDEFNSPNVRNFILLGDPALTLAYPKWNVKTNSINSVAVNAVPDTLKALSKITITGEVQDHNGVKLTNFNGIIYPTVFDKAVTYYTLGQDSNSTDPNDFDTPFPFSLQKNVLYRGKASVVNGDFSYTFVVPKDISFQYGFGRLSYYSTNGVEDANGYFENVVVGGINTSAANDTRGPDVKLYINDDKFVFGGLTDENPYLYATVVDSSGVNTAGTGIGHDITAQLDNDNQKLFVLNDYYQSDLNNYQKGTVKYKLADLNEGRHTLKFKVWDVYNNSSESYTEFIVESSATLALSHVLNYPNPFTTHTSFMFEYNCPCTSLQVMIQVFTISGKLIKTIDQHVSTEGYRADAISWDGLDDYGNRIGRGVYIYKLRVKASETKYAEKFEKLVILK
jgi:hypothetical protein